MGNNTAHSVKSDIGLKQTRNEDRFVADPALGLCVVCDGMGGNHAGEVARGRPSFPSRSGANDRGHQ